MPSWVARVSSAPGRKRSVAVQILGHEYRIRTEADEETVERVAHLLNETMERIRDRTGTVDTLDLAVLAGLNLGNDLVALRARAGIGAPNTAAMSQRLRGLIERVESELDESTRTAN